MQESYKIDGYIHLNGNYKDIEQLNQLGEKDGHLK
jgi:hypothetical protein